MVTRTLQALVILDLVDNEGMPTPTFEALRRAPQAEYVQRFAEFLRAAYQEVFAFIDPMTSTVDKVRDAFRAYSPAGQRDRMVALFLGLCEEAQILGDGARQRTPQDPQRRQARVRATVRTLTPAASRNQGRAPFRGSSNRTQVLPVALSGLLESLPNNGGSWSRSRRDKFVETFGAVLDFCYPVQERESDADRQEERQ